MGGTELRRQYTPPRKDRNRKDRAGEGATDTEGGAEREGRMEEMATDTEEGVGWGRSGGRDGIQVPREMRNRKVE